MFNIINWWRSKVTKFNNDQFSEREHRSRTYSQHSIKMWEKNIHARVYTLTYKLSKSIWHSPNFVEKASTLAIILQFRDIAYRVVALLRRYMYDFLALYVIYLIRVHTLYVTFYGNWSKKVAGCIKNISCADRSESIARW